MKVGQEVSYIDAEGDRHVATVTSIPGSGPSDFKTLDLTYRVGGEDLVVEGVPNVIDRTGSTGFWLFKGEVRPDPEDDPPTPDEVETVQEQIEEGSKPAARRRRTS